MTHHRTRALLRRLDDVDPPPTTAQRLARAACCGTAPLPDGDCDLAREVLYTVRAAIDGGFCRGGTIAEFQRAALHDPRFGDESHAVDPALLPLLAIVGERIRLLPVHETDRFA
ncbi:MAG: hypothetical protein JNN13_04445 [Planctomycetes bacterium]|nr:hypothetical protein [Planctomycetota bacterium]